MGGGGTKGDRVAMGGVSKESSVIMGNINSPPVNKTKNRENSKEYCVSKNLRI